MSETGYTEDCCFNDIRDQCPLQGKRPCFCRCHVEVPVPMRPECGHEAEIERYRQRSRDEDTARIRLNQERIRLRDAISEALYDYDHGDVLSAIDGLRTVIGSPTRRTADPDRRPAAADREA